MKTNLTAWVKQHSIVTYFVLAYAISWAVWLPLVLTAQGLIKSDIPFALYYLGSFGLGLSALVVTALTEGRTGLRHLLSRILKRRVKFG